VASGATLGILIPPSINLIIYGAITNTSIGNMFTAGIPPGLLLAALFMLTIILWCSLDHSIAGKRVGLAPRAVEAPGPAAVHLHAGNGRHLRRLRHPNRGRGGGGGWWRTARSATCASAAR
jgi:hypothetical protein